MAVVADTSETVYCCFEIMVAISWILFNALIKNHIWYCVIALLLKYILCFSTDFP